MSNKDLDALEDQMMEAISRAISTGQSMIQISLIEPDDYKQSLKDAADIGPAYTPVAFVSDINPSVIVTMLDAGKCKLGDQLFVRNGPKQEPDEFDLDEQPFYEVCYAYRIAPATDQQKVIKAFEELKKFIRRGYTRIVPQAPDPVPAIRSAMNQYYDALTERQHGGLAADRALNQIERILGMSWDARKKEFE